MQMKETILVGLTAEEAKTLEDFVDAIDLLNKLNLAEFSLQDLRELFLNSEVDVANCHFEIDVNY